MTKCVLDIGNCGPDHSSIRTMLANNFEVQLLQADATQDALAKLADNPVDLILVNRKLDVDYSDGTDVIAAIKADKRFKDIPIMLITNLEEHQAAAIALGAVPGFGKLALRAPATIQLLAKYLVSK